jgi:O-antigen/teichoic acid export membrane protein
VINFYKVKDFGASFIRKELIGIIPFIKNAILYFGGSLVQLIVSLVTSPIFARNLSAEEFGIIGYFTSLSQFIFPLTTLSLTFYYLSNYFKQDNNTNKKLLSNILIFLTLSNIFIACVSYGFLYVYFNIAKITMPFFPFAILMLLTVFLEVYKTFLLINFKLKKEALTYFLYSSLLAILSIAISLIFVVILKWGAAGKMAGTLVAMLFVFLAFIKHFKIELKLKIDFKIIKEGLNWSFPMILSAYFYLPLANIDRILLEPLGNIKELGFYSIGGNIAAYLSTAAIALYSAFEPDFFKHVVQRNTKKFFINTLLYLMVLLLLTGIFLIFSKNIVYYLTSGRYTRAYIYANYFAVAFFFMNTAKVTNSIILALGKSRGQLYINIIAGVIGFASYKLLIFKFGFIGASYGRISVAVVYLVTQVLFILNMVFLKKNTIELNIK